MSEKSKVTVFSVLNGYSEEEHDLSSKLKATLTTSNDVNWKKSVFPPEAYMGRDIAQRSGLRMFVCETEKGLELRDCESEKIIAVVPYE